MSGQPIRIICDRAKVEIAAGDWHDVGGHHRYYGSSATNGGERIAESRRGARPRFGRCPSASDQQAMQARRVMSAGWLLLFFLPFMLSLLGKAPMPRVLCFVSSAMAMLLSVQPGGAVLPWGLGMVIAVISVRERIHSLFDFKKRGGIAPAALQLLQLAGPGLRPPRCRAQLMRSAGDPSEVTALETRHWITSFR